MRVEGILGKAFMAIMIACASQAATVLDVDFSELSPGTISDGQGVLDSSGNGYHTVLKGGADFTVHTNSGNVHVENTSAAGAARFELVAGTTNAAWAGSTPTNFVLEAANSYTFEAVVKPHTASGVQGLMGTADPTTEFWYRINGGALQYLFKDLNGTNVVDTSNNSDVSGYIADGQFHNFTLVLDKGANEARTYVDGTLINTLTNANIGALVSVLDGSEEFRVAGYNTFNGLYGISDRYRISDTVLATNEFLTAPASVPADTLPPMPNPATFATPPAAADETSITMTATAGIDASGPVEYSFTETSGNPGGTSSGWVTDPVYTDTGLTTGTEYTYTVTMRDALSNTGTASAPASATPVATVAGTVLEMDFEYLTAGDTIADGTRLQDISGNGYHGFWGHTAGDTTIVATTNGVGIDNTTPTNPGYIYVRDGLTGIPEEWDGPTTTVSPYFTLDGAGSWTMEAVVKWDTATVTVRNGIMGQTGGNQIWIREDSGNLHYAIGTSDAVNRFDGTINVSAEKADGKFHSIALVYDGPAGEVRTYVDGVLKDTNTDVDIGTLPALLNGTSDFRLGDYNGSSNFDGTMDHFRISNTALTPAEFLPVGSANPPPTAAVLTIQSGAGSVTVTATGLESTATYTLQSKDDLVSGTWTDIPPAITGVTATNWVVATTNAAFFQVEGN